MLFVIVYMSLQEGKLTASLKAVISLERVFLIAQETTLLVLSHSVLHYNKLC